MESQEYLNAKNVAKDQSPLEYALNRNSRQAASVLLDHIINSDELSTKM